MKEGDECGARKALFHLRTVVGARSRCRYPSAEERGFGDLVGPSDLPIQGHPAPRPLSDKEIWEYVDLYATAAKNAVEVAGL